MVALTTGEEGDDDEDNGAGEEKALEATGAVEEEDASFFASLALPSLTAVAGLVEEDDEELDEVPAVALVVEDLGD